MGALSRFWCWLVDHPKEYVAIRDAVPYEDRCSHGYRTICCHEKGGFQIARWRCGKCGLMGVRYLKSRYGLWMIKFGKLVPDEKRWSDFKSKERG